MHNDRRTNGLRSIAVAAITLAVLSGCAQTKSLMSGLRKSPAAPGDAGILGAPQADQYLQELRDLAAYLMSGGDKDNKVYRR